jgi:hypothetical protein
MDPFVRGGEPLAIKEYGGLKVDDWVKTVASTLYPEPFQITGFSRSFGVVYAITDYYGPPAYFPVSTLILAGNVGESSAGY